MRDYSICPIDINRPKGSRIKLGIHWSNRRDAIYRVSTVSAIPVIIRKFLKRRDKSRLYRLQ